MLSAIGRAATRRVASSSCNVAGSASRLVFVSRFSIAGPSSRGAASTVSSVKRTARGYATATATKSTSTSKKAPAKKATTTKKAAAKPKAKAKTTAAKKTTKAKKAAKPKPKPKAKPRRVSAETMARLEKRDLKKAALFEEPKTLPEQPYQVFVKESLEGNSPGPDGMVVLFREVAKNFQALSSYEKQRYQERGEENKRINAVNYKAWVESHTPETIWNARKARTSLKRKYNVPKGRVKTIQDDRQPTSPTTAYALYTRARWSTGNFSGTALTEATQTISSDWKNMSDKERQPYHDMATAEVERYTKEVTAILGRPVSKPRSKSP